jgi:SAM-dependent methyltransferase
MSAATVPPDHALRAYQALAPAYDTLTAHHEYGPWTENLERLARRAGLRGRRLLDVACGTGKSFLPFLARRYDVTACDLSPGMLALARAKSGGRARLSVQDMRELPVLGAFDLITCLDDALNYLLEPEELDAALAGMARNLAPGGVLVADTNCIATYRGFFANLSVVAAEDRVIVWRGEAPPGSQPGERVRARVEVLFRDGNGAWREESHVHVQRHHPESAVRRAVAAAGLRLAGVHGMTTDGAFREGFDELESSKAVYVATRPR